MAAAFWLYLSVAIPYSLFVILYATRSPWYKTGMGRSLLLSKTVIAVLSIHAVLSLLFPHYPGQDSVRGFVVGGAIIAGWSQLVLLFIEQERARRCPESTPEENP